MVWLLRRDSRPCHRLLLHRHEAVTALGGGLGLWGFSTAIIGMVGEYLVRMNYEMGRKPKYLVRRTHE